MATQYLESEMPPPFIGYRAGRDNRYRRGIRPRPPPPPPSPERGKPPTHCLEPPFDFDQSPRKYSPPSTEPSTTNSSPTKHIRGCASYDSSCTEDVNYQDGYSSTETLSQARGFESTPLYAVSKTPYAMDELPIMPLQAPSAELFKPTNAHISPGRAFSSPSFPHSPTLPPSISSPFNPLLLPPRRPPPPALLTRASAANRSRTLRKSSTFSTLSTPPISPPFSSPHSSSASFRPSNGSPLRIQSLTPATDPLSVTIVDELPDMREEKMVSQFSDYGSDDEDWGVGNRLRSFSLTAPLRGSVGSKGEVRAEGRKRAGSWLGCCFGKR